MRKIRLVLLAALPAILLGIPAFLQAQTSSLRAGDSIRVNLQVIGLTSADRTQRTQAIESQEARIAELRRNLQDEEMALRRMQEELGINEAGASQRQEFVGRIISVEGQLATLMARGQPRCRAGEMIGDAPICDPAPIIRRTIDLSQVSVERREVKSNQTLRLIGGGLLGGAVFGALGYTIGPSLGFGKVGGCREVTGTSFCTEFQGLTAEEIAERTAQQDVDQRVSDQRRGLFFFGIVGATAAGILTKKLSAGWVAVDPLVPVSRSDSWGLEIKIPSRFP
ncbi:MAG: hypothetical protein CME18_02050 [Gemmatimonadetes bacterium]|nr:hypothetical protein [Gemmatimonadota bacterium]